MFVTKADGRREPFQREKIIRTCLRNHVSREVAEKVASKIEAKAYDGIETKKILEMIFDFLKDYKPVHGYHTDLKEAISLLKPKPDFEEFIRIVLRTNDYEVRRNRIVKGFCVEHEIDGIAYKNGKKILLEVKHHTNYHVYIGLETCLEYYAAFLDMNEGSEIKFDKLLIACNTKFSDHAKKYAKCKGIMLLGWRYPVNNGLEDLIEKFKLYPITYLAGLSKNQYERLSNVGIITLEQLIKADLRELQRATKIKIGILEDLRNKAEEIMKLG
jgi:hypothetical protein